MPITNPTPRLQPTAPNDSGQLVELTVTAWRDPVVEGHPAAIPTCSDDALIWWTPSVGPTGMLMAHRFAAYASEGPTAWAVADLAATFGMRGGSGRLVHTLTWLERFGIISFHDTPIRAAQLRRRGGGASSTPAAKAGA